MHYDAPRVFQTARDDGTRLAECAPPPRASAEPGLRTLSAYPESAFQIIEGFGGSFTESAAVTWAALDEAGRARLLHDYFAADTGHGYTLCRVPMGSCDFALGNYAHVEDPGDVALAGFSIARDRTAMLPFIKAAAHVAGRPLRLLVSPWSPPAWMKSSGTMNHGGHLLARCRAAWAACYVRFIQAYAAEGVPVWGVTVQNEPEATQRWDSCLYSGEEERDFIRDHLGPALHAAGLAHVRIVIWDHNRDRMVERAAAVLGDAAAARYVWGTGFHWYGPDHFHHVQLVHDAWPDKKLLFTEGCQEGGPHAGSWELGERYARSIINDLNRWTVGWIDWNLCLDLAGGPNHVGNYCSAPILIDPQARTLSHQSSYYYIGHFARFIRPGARRILCATADPALETTAAVNPDGSVAVVVLNASEQARAYALCVGAHAWRCGSAPRSITTYTLAANSG